MSYKQAEAGLQGHLISMPVERNARYGKVIMCSAHNCDARKEMTSIQTNGHMQLSCYRM
jgi:hypothetical protein